MSYLTPGIRAMEVDKAKWKLWNCPSHSALVKIVNKKQYCIGNIGNKRQILQIFVNAVKIQNKFIKFYYKYCKEKTILPGTMAEIEATLKDPKDSGTVITITSLLNSIV